MNFSYLFTLISCISVIVPMDSFGAKSYDNDFSVNYVIGDISFIEKFSISPDQYTEENLRIKTHLEYVENLLRSKDISHLTDLQKEGREKALELLHEYWLAGRFPNNYDHPGQRRPCFEDKDGSICAVGYLIAKTTGHDLVEKINSRHQYDYIKDITLPEIPLWCDEYGLTLEECAMIQPTYYKDKDGKMIPGSGPPMPRQEDKKPIPIEDDNKDEIRYINNKDHSYTPKTQKSAYCVLSEGSFLYKIIQETKENPSDSVIKIGIKTDCEPGKEGEWDCYRFISPLKDKLRAIGDNVPRFLIINNKPFTGYLKIVKDIDTDLNMNVLQFNNGYYETGNVINNPYCTLRPYGYTAPPTYYRVPPPVRKQVEPPPNIVNPLPSTPQPPPKNDPGLAQPKKPVLYLYPTAKQDVSVQLVLNDHKIIHPYPAYNEGWNVTANTDGTLINKATGKEHYCLFWETEGKSFLDEFKSGFVVKGNETAAFLEEKLSVLGLNSKEANEFIIFWLPQMENNPFNIIYFSVEEYESISQLNITPTPDTQIRIMMLWEPLSNKISLPEQVLPETPVRKGFVAVEWGGTKIKTLYSAEENITGQR